jgi:hypothetical protein
MVLIFAVALRAFCQSGSTLRQRRLAALHAIDNDFADHVCDFGIQTHQISKIGNVAQIASHRGRASCSSAHSEF